MAPLAWLRQHDPNLAALRRAGRTAIVCPIHLGFMQGALKTWAAPVTVDRLDAFVEPDLCVAHLTGVGAGAEGFIG